MDKAVVSLTTSIKNAAATMKRHMLKIQTDKAKQDKKAIQASEKLKLAEQKEELQGRARKVMSTVAELRSFFKLETEEFDKFAVIACDSKGLPASFIDSSVPVVIDAKAAVDELLSCSKS